MGSVHGTLSGDYWAAGLPCIEKKKKLSGDHQRSKSGDGSRKFIETIADRRPPTANSNRTPPRSVLQLLRSRPLLPSVSPHARMNGMKDNEYHVWCQTHGMTPWYPLILPSSWHPPAWRSSHDTLLTFSWYPPAPARTTVKALETTETMPHAALIKPLFSRTLRRHKQWHYLSARSMCNDPHARAPTCVAPNEQVEAR